MVLLVLYVWLRDPAPSDLGGSLRLGGAVGLAGLCNTPLLLLAGLPIVHALLAADLRRSLRVSLLVGGTAFTMVAAVVLTHAALKYGDPAVYFERSSEYAARYAAADRLLEPSAYADVSAVFFAFAVAAPKPAVPGRGQKAKYFKHYLAGPGGLVGLAAVVIVTALAVFAAFGRHWRIALPVLAFLAGITASYAYFNPPDAMLYSNSAPAGALRAPDAWRPLPARLTAYGDPGPCCRGSLAGSLATCRLSWPAPTISRSRPTCARAKASELGIAAATCNYRHPGSPRCRTAAPPDRPSTASSQSPGRQHVIR